MVSLEDQLSNVLRDSLKAGLPSVSACIGNKNGIVWSGQEGFADIPNQLCVQDQHIFGLGSITKVFLSVVTLQLIEEGRLLIDDVVGKFLTDGVIGGIANAASATIGSLMNHTSGIATWEFEPVWIRDGRGENCDPDRIWGKMDCLHYIRGKPPTARGEWHYSNTNFTILGLVVEQITGNTAESEVRHRILEPLNLSAIYLEGFEVFDKKLLPRRYHFATPAFVETAGIAPRFTKVKEGLIGVSQLNLSVEWLAGGFVANPKDLVRFGVALRDGKLLKPESMAYMKAWRPAAPGIEVSHGLFRTETPSGFLVGHNGGVLGFTASFWWAEKDDCVVALLSNVGAMHSGPGQITAADVAIRSRFVDLAMEISKRKISSS